MVTLVGRSIQQVSRVSLLRAGGGRGACCASQTPPPPTLVPPDQAHPLASTPDPLPQNSLLPDHPTYNNHLAELDFFSIAVTAICYGSTHRAPFIKYLRDDCLLTSKFFYNDIIFLMRCMSDNVYLLTCGRVSLNVFAQTYGQCARHWNSCCVPEMPCNG